MGGPPYLEPSRVTIYYAQDSHLSRVLIFYWPVTTTGSSVSSRHRVTIFTRIGHASFSPFQVSPQSSYYGAVAQLSDERQREEIYRVMVFSLAKYFDTVPAASKENGFDSRHVHLYDDRHAGAIANRLCKVTNTSRVLEDVQSFYSSATKIESTPRPSSSSRSTTFSAEQKEAVRLAMCEVVDTEERYVSKLHDLLFNVISEFREKSMTRTNSSTSPSDAAVSKLFPSSLDAIFTVNRSFLDAIRSALESTEDSALTSISLGTDPSPAPASDSLGIRAFSKVLVDWFPKFLYPYKEYLFAHTSFPTLLSTLLNQHAQSSFSHRIRCAGGEQRLRSMLMEPVQRLPRYSLLIDSILAPLPEGDPSIKLLLRARGVVEEICAMETPVSKVLESLSISYDEIKEVRSRSPAKFLSSLASGEDNVEMRAVPRLAMPGDDRDHIGADTSLRGRRGEPEKDRDYDRERERERERDQQREKEREREREREREQAQPQAQPQAQARDRGREKPSSTGGSLRRAWSRRLSPGKKERERAAAEALGKMPALKENIPPPPSSSSRQGLGGGVLQSLRAGGGEGELERLRAENRLLRERLRVCVCGAGGAGEGVGTVGTAGGNSLRGVYR